MINRIIVILVPAILVFLPVSSFALFDDEFRHEIKGFYLQEDISDEKPSKNSMYVLQYTFSFRNILIEDGPYEELGFIQKASYAFAAGIKGQNKADKLEADIKGFLGGIHYIFPEPFIINCFYQKSLAEEDSSELKLTEDTYTGKLGYYLSDELICFAGYSRVNKKSEVGIYSYNEEEYTNTFLGGFKFVYVINDRLSYNLFGTYEHNRNSIENNPESVNNVYSIEGDLYPVPMFGLGAGLKINSGDLAKKEGVTFMARVRFYFIQYAGINFKYERFRAEDAEESSGSNYFEIGLTGRL